MSRHYTEADKPRLEKQLDRVRDFMLSAGHCETWLTLADISRMTGFPQPSISADLRHLRKKQNGGFVVEKRLRGGQAGLWEYRVSRNQERAA